MDVFSVILRQHCTAVSEDSRHHHDRNIEAKKRHFEKKRKKKVHSFLTIFHMVSVQCTRTRCGNARDTYKTHTNGTERPAKGPHIPFSGQFDSCQDRHWAQVAFWVKTHN